RTATSRPAARRGVPDHRRRRQRSRFRRKGRLLRGRSRGKANVLATAHREWSSIPRIAADETESGTKAGGRVVQDLTVPIAAAGDTGLRQVLPIHRMDLSVAAVRE